MRYLSVCSGIGSDHVAWSRLGWECAGFAESDEWPAAVLAHHYPDVPNFGDFTQIEEKDCGPVELVCGGTPCQSFSVAGKRKGLDDARGNLAIEYVQLAERLRPRWLVWENVPGVLSQNQGRAYGAFVGALGDIGYCVAYRILDVQYFRTQFFPRAIPQRRRRVFVVGYFGDWRPPAGVLLEPHCVSGHSPPGRKAREGVAPTFKGRADGGGGYGSTIEEAEALVAGTVSCKWAKGTGGPAGDECQNLIPFDLNQITSGENRANPKPGDPCHTIIVGSDSAVAGFNSAQDPAFYDGSAGPVMSNQNVNGVLQSKMVRRLTPLECERLFGLPDLYTAVLGPNGKPMSNTARYALLGNAIGQNVLGWLGERIDMVDHFVINKRNQA